MSFAFRVGAPLMSAAVLAISVAGCGGSDAAKTGNAATSPAETVAGHGSHVTSAEPKASSSPAKVDAAFVREMIPHHALAIEMAKIALDRTDRPQLRTFAQAIISTQGKETTELKAAAKRLGVNLGSGMDAASMKADAESLGLSDASMGMAMDTSALKRANPFDLLFLAQMTPHHRGAIAMSSAEVAYGGDAALKRIARSIITGQQAEVAKMAAWQREWYPPKSN